MPLLQAETFPLNRCSLDLNGDRYGLLFQAWERYGATPPKPVESLQRVQGAENPLVPSVLEECCGNGGEHGVAGVLEGISILPQGVEVPCARMLYSLTHLLTALHPPTM